MPTLGIIAALMAMFFLGFFFAVHLANQEDERLLDLERKRIKSDDP